MSIERQPASAAAVFIESISCSGIAAISILSCLLIVFVLQSHGTENNFSRQSAQIDFLKSCFLEVLITILNAKWI